MLNDLWMKFFSCCCLLPLFWQWAKCSSLYVMGEKEPCNLEISLKHHVNKQTKKGGVTQNKLFIWQMFSAIC